MTEAAVRRHLAWFCRCFDEQDWEALARCLTDPVHVDYSSFRAEPPGELAATEYAARRREALGHLRTQHLHLNHLVDLESGVARVRCEYVVHRWPRDEGDARWFHSYGHYDFVLLELQGQWRIHGITQHLRRNDGDPSLHRAPLRAS